MPASAAALRAAIFGALKSDGPLAAMLGGAKIYDEPPREASLPYVTLGEAVSSCAKCLTARQTSPSRTCEYWVCMGEMKRFPGRELCHVLRVG